LTSVLGCTLLVAIPIIAITGFVSNAAYYPRLGHNSVGRSLGPLDLYLFSFPTHPSWLYAVNQGLHITIGLAAFPILLAKLWSVIPKLFEWPPVRSPAHERLTLALLVGGALFEFVTGILNIQYAYLFGFFFTTAHYWGAWVFTGAFLAHTAIKLPTMRKALAARRGLAPLREGLGDTLPEPPLPGASELIPVSPAAPTMSRRALLGTVGAGSLFLLVQGVGQAIGGPFRALAFLAPRGRHGRGANGFPINRTAAAAQITAGHVDANWRLRVIAGPRTLSVSRAELLAMPQHTYELPIACVEGWSTTQRWTGVRISDLAAAAGLKGEVIARTRSLATNGVFDAAVLASEQISDQRTLVALKVNDTDLSLDHGFPARVIGPGIPGVHCTKWLAMLTIERA